MSIGHNVVRDITRWVDSDDLEEMTGTGNIITGRAAGSRR